MEIILIPIIAALVTAGLGKRSNVWISTLLSLIPLAVLYTYFTRFGVENGWKTIFDLPWISENIRFTLGFDGLTGMLLLLTNLMVPVIVMAGIRDDENRVKLTALTLFMQGALNGVFMARAVELSRIESIWVGAGILLAFAVKIPLLPFHSWQADTYTHSPAAGSMLLSGIMLKMGLYGLLRWYLPLAPESIEFFQPWIIGLSVAGVLYGALIAIRQKDMKRLIAFSSLSHVALIAAGIFTLTAEGLEGGVLQMFVHGVNVIGLFLVVELIEKSTGTRLLGELGGLAKSNRSFMIFFMLLALGTVAVPFTNGFPGEFMLLKAVYMYNPNMALLAGLTIIFCAVYIFRMVQFSMFGEGKHEVSSLKWNEYVAFGILSVAVLLIGFVPQLFVDVVHSSILQIVTWVSEAKGVLS